MTEWEDTGLAWCGSRGGGAGGHSYGLGGAARCGGYQTVSPGVSHHSPGGVHGGGAPRGRRVGVGALVVGGALVGEGEDAGRAGCGDARVWDSLLQEGGA